MKPRDAKQQVWRYWKLIVLNMFAKSDSFLCLQKWQDVFRDQSWPSGVMRCPGTWGDHVMMLHDIESGFFSKVGCVLWQLCVPFSFYCEEWVVWSHQHLLCNLGRTWGQSCAAAPRHSAWCRCNLGSTWGVFLIMITSIVFPEWISHVNL